MAYITLSNSKRLLRSIDLKQFENLAGQVYKKDIYFLSSREKSILIGIRELLKDPNNFAIEFYKPIEVVDSFKYVIEEHQPAYHSDNSCSRLQSNFKNFEIPEEIKAKGPDGVKAFRQWFKANLHLLDKPDAFVARLQSQWGIVTNPKAIDYSNSGAEDYSNLNLEELEIKIDEILRAAGKYFKDNPEEQGLIKRYGKLTFLAYVHGDIYKNDTGLNDQELKDFLKYYDQTFKQPIKELLLQYYRVLYNFHMTFEGSLLEKFGFRSCTFCQRQNKVEDNLPPESISGKIVFTL